MLIFLLYFLLGKCLNSNSFFFLTKSLFNWNVNRAFHDRSENSSTEIPKSLVKAWFLIE